MLHVLRMPLALRAACATRLRAGCDDRADHFDIELGLTSKEAARRFTHVSTVKVEADAAHELPQLLLSKTGVCASVTRLGALHEDLDAGRELTDLKNGLPGVSL